jgi:lysophospholipase L1-like esterase
MSALSVLLGACGGTGVGPTGVGPTPLPTSQVATNPVTFVAFFDENANGMAEPTEGTRIPGVELVAGSARGTTAVLTGTATLQVPAGSQTLTVTATTLPPFYRGPTAPIPVTSPSGAQVMVPITLPRGSNRANVYLAFGDSITRGEPEVGDGTGYRSTLQALLRAHFGSAEVAERGRDATESSDGAENIGRDLRNILPSFVMIHYGTNDWNNLACRSIPCFTTVSLRSIVRQINQAGSHAFLATIIPTNTGYDGRAPASRNDWVAAQNTIIKQIADEEGAVLVDLNDAFLKSGRALPTLFVDHVHPTAVGYDIMAQTWFSAITKAYSRILN